MRSVTIVKLLLNPPLGEHPGYEEARIFRCRRTQSWHDRRQRCRPQALSPQGSDTSQIRDEQAFLTTTQSCESWRVASEGGAGDRASAAPSCSSLRWMQSSDRAFAGQAVREARACSLLLRASCRSEEGVLSLLAGLQLPLLNQKIAEQNEHIPVWYFKSIFSQGVHV